MSPTDTTRHGHNGPLNDLRQLLLAGNVAVRIQLRQGRVAGGSTAGASLEKGAQPSWPAQPRRVPSGLSESAVLLMVVLTLVQT